MTDIKKTNVVWKLFGNSFLVDLFGIFMPGVVAIGATVLIGAFLIWYVMDKNIFNALSGSGANSAYSIGWLFVIALSYAVGAVLYRRGPKHPDYIAAYNQCKQTKGAERHRLAYEFIPRKGKNKCFVYQIYKRMLYFYRKYDWIKRNSKYNPDYPYPFLRRYMYKRGFSHLTDYVNWCEGHRRYTESKNTLEQNDKGKRSKQVVNIIKLRLASFVSSKVNDDIVRNESHVRLISSLWYVMCYVRFISIVAMLTISFDWHLIISNIIPDSFTPVESGEKGSERLNFNFKKERKDLFVPALAVLCSIIAMSTRIKRDIELSIHYVRVRELITIFEAAWVYDNKLRDWRQPKLFDDITKAGREFGEKICQECRHFPKCCPQQNELKEKKQEQS